MKAEVGDVIRIYFKNMASFPFNLRPTGLKFLNESISGSFLFKFLHFKVLFLQIPPVYIIGLLEMLLHQLQMIRILFCGFIIVECESHVCSISLKTNQSR